MKEKDKVNQSFIRNKEYPKKRIKTIFSAAYKYKMMKQIVSYRSYKLPPNFQRQSNIQKLHKQKQKHLNKARTLPASPRAKQKPTLTSRSFQVYMFQQLIIITLMSQNPGRTIRCPFDPNHVMPYDRFLNHLDKCKFADKKSYAKCRYNPYHVFHKETIANHEKKCEDRKKYEVESDEDSWGVEDDIEKPEKSTVSTSVTAFTSNCPQSKYETKAKPSKMTPVPKFHNGEAQDFDQYDFLTNKSRQ